MKRDVDLARKILFDVEECGDTDSSGYLTLEFDGHSEKEVLYHIGLLSEAGLIETQEVSLPSGLKTGRARQTWAGHEFLDAAREETRWQKAKHLVIDKTGGLSFEVLKQVLSKLALDSLIG